MIDREALKKELDGLPEPMLGEVVDFVRFLKAKRDASGVDTLALLEQTFGSIPDIVRPSQGDMPSPRKLA
jgi:hypothetical protein